MCVRFEIRSSVASFKRALRTSRPASSLCVRAAAALVSIILVASSTVASPQSIEFEANPVSTSCCVSPYTMLAVDFDGDGDLDRAVVGPNSDGVEVARNDGTGRFGGGVYYPTDLLTWGLTSGDWDHDGRPDLATASAVGTLTILRNLGNGTFGGATNYPTNAVGQAFGLTSADLDGDGDLDIAMAISGPTTNKGLGIFLNQGNGTFVLQPGYVAGGARYQIVSGDFDHDGDIDLALTGSFGTTVAVMSNDGSAHFTLANVLTTQPGSFAMAVADLDGDGDLDLATANRESSSISVFQNSGALQFAPQAVFAAPFPYGLAAGDFDGDGDIDLASIAYTDTAACGITLLRNLGTGQFTSSVQYPAGQSIALVSADLDGDGRIDLMNATLHAQIETIFGSGNGSFASVPGYPCGPRPIAAVVAKIDADRRLDVVTVDSGDLTIDVLFNQGDGRLGPPTAYPAAAGVSGVAVGDVDGDGDLDIVTSNTAPAFTLLLNQSDGTFVPAPTITIPSIKRCVALADLDGDQDLDLVFGCDGFIVWAPNPGNGSFGPPIAFGTGGNVKSLKARDMNADGLVDLVEACVDSVRVQFNQGGGVFGAPVVLPTFDGTYSIALADLDGDGDLDIVACATDGLRVFLNNGGGSFTAAATLYTLLNGSLVCAADFDLDGDIDLAAADTIGQSIQVFANDGSGHFTPAQTLATWPGNRSIEAADLDGDGDPDLVTANLLSDNVAVTRNTTASGNSLCFGDGSGTPCPCGNPSAVGAHAGCRNGLGSAGTLRGSGSARLADDTLVLSAAGMPNAAALYFQGASSSMPAAVFGDGLRCVGGTLIRLGVEMNSNHASSYPVMTDARVSVKGQVHSPGVRYYQVWYRDNGSSCGAGMFNLTNAWRVVWSP